jgi:outer membrane receptor protein involved in Fe transport
MGFGLWIAFLPYLLWSSPSVQSPADTQRVSGEIVDTSGAPLPRASVEIRDDQGRLIAATQTNSRGQYALDLPRKYTLSVILAGFASVKDRIVEVPGETSLQPLTLQISPHQEKVVVTATRTETPLSLVGSSVTTISGDELSLKGTSSVSDALREIAGISVVQSGGVGKVTSLFLRGGESDYTKILVDGIPINEPGGSYNFSNLSTSSIDRIEVVRGPQSALFGSDAITGVIQIFTKRGKSEGYHPNPP